ncbi:hypothetical protein CALCODRAFT_489866 [Calocera cornea HHB12733]|uniref:Uncharacterized protein n=1 Tax=Calocera cornea HHB12733 TaxID=1353952 RepID=A0A165K047_9BASI|nr:hypothetical protein CALCODRAFT_489866 [Calocera cornea HHB12733]
MSSHATRGRLVIPCVRRGYAETPAVSSARRKPRRKSIELAQHLMEHGAPKIEGNIATLSEQELNGWIIRIRDETDIGIPPTKTQLTLAQRMVEQGAPNADQMREGMTWRELDTWIGEAENLGWKPPIHETDLKIKQRCGPATAAQLAYARDLASYAGLEVPYDPENAKRGEVANFIGRARAELIHQDKAVSGRAVPSGPWTKWQRTRLRDLGVKLPDGTSWGEAQEKLEELGVVKRSKKKGVGAAMSAKKENAKEGEEPELGEESAEMKLSEEVYSARSKGNAEGQLIDERAKSKAAIMDPDFEVVEDTPERKRERRVARKKELRARREARREARMGARSVEGRTKAEPSVGSAQGDDAGL